MEDLERFLKAIANRRRLQILKYLKRHGEATVGDISKNIGLSIKSTSKHLILLSNLDILERRQRNPLVFYDLNPKQRKEVRYMISTL